MHWDGIGWGFEILDEMLDAAPCGFVQYGFDRGAHING